MNDHEMLRRSVGSNSLKMITTTSMFPGRNTGNGDSGDGSKKYWPSAAPLLLMNRSSSMIPSIQNSSTVHPGPRSMSTVV